MILSTANLEIIRKHVPLQCVFHSIRFKVNKKIGCLGEIAFFYGNHPRVFMQSLFFSLFLRDAYGCIKLKNSSDSQ